METYTLLNGVTIPKIGFGTWQIPEGEEAYNSVSFALKAGYTHIDTAQIYGNEVSVGKAIADSGGRVTRKIRCGLFGSFAHPLAKSKGSS